MKRKIVNKNIPVRFEEVESYDSRFQKVKIWLMHLGKNYNGSIFSKESVLNSLDSLKNTPILGYIEESRLGEKDFKGHEVEFVVEDGDLKEKYVGQAFGVISESCNPRFEFKQGDDGEYLEYLVVDGLLWTKFDDPISILSENGEVSESMEIHDDYDGFWDEEGWFNFTKFKFYGACMLGKNVSPAMQKASVELAFAKDSIKEEVARKLEEFSELINSKQFKEVGNEMDLKELLAKYSISIEDLEGKGINADEFSVEELEVKIQELFAKKESDKEESEKKDEADELEEKEEAKVEDEVTDEVEDEGESEDFEKKEEVKAEKFSKVFELSHDDIRTLLYKATNDELWIMEVFDNYFIASDWMETKYYKVKYSRNGDEVELVGDSEEVFPMFLTQEEKGALELMRANFSKLEEENKELKTFKSQVIEERREQEIEALFARDEFSRLEESDLVDLQGNMSNFSVKEIESKLYEILGRKNATKFSSTKKKEPQKISIKIDNEDKIQSPYAHILKRQGLI